MDHQILSALTTYIHCGLLLINNKCTTYNSIFTYPRSVHRPNKRKHCWFNEHLFWDSHQFCLFIYENALKPKLS